MAVRHQWTPEQIDMVTVLKFHRELSFTSIAIKFKEAFGRHFSRQFLVLHYKNWQDDRTFTQHHYWLDRSKDDADVKEILERYGCWW
ncbi:hypothetical protein MMC12_006423 [Toensbergia leucococca]|nr:hypothetical protein [Toensbergia leucococca]